MSPKIAKFDIQNLVLTKYLNFAKNDLKNNFDQKIKFDVKY